MASRAAGPGRVAEHDVGAGAPSSPTAASAEQAVAPAPMIVTLPGRGRARLGQRVDDALHVGVVAVAAVRAEHHRVRAAGGGGELVDVVEQRQHGALERHGQATGPPTPGRGELT